MFDKNNCRTAMIKECSVSTHHYDELIHCEVYVLDEDLLGDGKWKLVLFDEFGDLPYTVASQDVVELYILTQEQQDLFIKTVRDLKARTYNFRLMYSNKQI